MMKRLFFVFVMLAGCYNPTFVSGKLLCGAGGVCPEAFFCGTDNRCYSEATGMPGTSDMGTTTDGGVTTDGGQPDLLPPENAAPGIQLSFAAQAGSPAPIAGGIQRGWQLSGKVDVVASMSDEQPLDQLTVEFRLDGKVVNSTCDKPGLCSARWDLISMPNEPLPLPGHQWLVTATDKGGKTATETLLGRRSKCFSFSVPNMAGKYCAPAANKYGQPVQPDGITPACAALDLCPNLAQCVENGLRMPDACSSTKCGNNDLCDGT